MLKLSCKPDPAVTNSFSIEPQTQPKSRNACHGLMTANKSFKPHRDKYPINTQNFERFPLIRFKI